MEQQQPKKGNQETEKKKNSENLKKTDRELEKGNSEK